MSSTPGTPRTVKPALVRPDSTPAPPPQPDQPGVAVDPTGLSRGPDPGLSWYDVGTRTVHHGGRATPVSFAGTVDSLTAAGTSDLLVVSGAGDRSTVLRVDPDGSSTAILRARRTAAPVVVAPDGRTFAWPGGSGEHGVVVAQVDDGDVVATHRFPHLPTQVLTLTADSALVSSDERTVRWNLHDDSVSTVIDDPTLIATRDDDRAALQVAESGRIYVTGLAGDSGTSAAWSLPRRERPTAFSPDGTMLLTGREVEADFRGYDTYQQPLRVREAASGRVHLSFTGRFGWYGEGEARWEDADHFLAVARNLDYRSGDATVRRSWVRCSVAGRSCEAAGPIETPRLDVPPYGPLERLVAEEPTS